MEYEIGYCWCHSGCIRDRSLTLAIELSVYPRRHVSRQQQIRIIHIDQARRRGKIRAGIDHLFRCPSLALRSPLFQTLLEQPHAIYIFQEINFTSDTTFIAEVLVESIVADARRIQNAAYQRPGSRADKSPVVSLCRNSRNR